MTTRSIGRPMPDDSTRSARRPARRARRGPTTVAAITTVVALVLAACSTEGKKEAATSTTRPGSTSSTTQSDATTPQKSPVAGTLKWTDCGDNECATLDVPLDYSKPDGETFEIGILRRPATDPDKRVGAIFVNPGGPGGSATDIASYLPFSDEITSRFDIVGVDPRGVGRSSM